MSGRLLARAHLSSHQLTQENSHTHTSDAMRLTEAAKKNKSTEFREHTTQKRTVTYTSGFNCYNGSQFIPMLMMLLLGWLGNANDDENDCKFELIMLNFDMDLQRNRPVLEE